MKFNSAFNRINDVISNISGDNTKEPLFSERVNNDGVYEVYQSGFHNLQDDIDASLESSKIENIIEKAIRGDFSGMNNNEPMYGDFSGLPDNINDATKKIKQIEKMLDDNDIDKDIDFYTRLQMLENKILLSVKDDVDSNVESEVNNNE